VNDLQFNDKVYDANFIKHDDIQKGGKLNFEMSNKPNMKRGIGDDSSPYSMSKE